MRFPGLRTKTTEHFRRDGKAKQSYPDEAAAREAAQHHHANAYRCRFCKRWHIGGKSR